MAIGAALVDRARVIANESTGIKTEGTTHLVPTKSAWFKVRLFLDMNQSPERAEQGERKKVVHTPSLMFGVKDLNGDPLELKAEHEVEVKSVFGTHVYRLTADPQPIRKKRRVIGGLVTVERVVERPRTGAEF